MYQVMLGSDTDDSLFQRLCDEVHSLGGSIEDTKWLLGGSQEITTYTIILPEGMLEAEADTYVGLSLRGPLELVSMLAQRVLPNQLLEPTSVDKSPSAD